jgi:DNA-binding transcriptional ArsR family regulator
VSDRTRAAALLHPLRVKILQLAREPLSASELGARLGLPRQRVNYHVRQLAGSGFLRRAGRRRRRNMIEQRYIASARAFLLSPELLRPIGADWRRIEDAGSAAYLLALSSQMQEDVIRAWRGATRAGQRLSTLSIKSQFCFETPGQRETFTRALRDAVVEVIARHTSPNLRPDGSPAPWRPYRLVLGCYPYTPETPKQEE